MHAMPYGTRLVLVQNTQVVPLCHSPTELSTTVSEPLVLTPGEQVSVYLKQQTPQLGAQPKYPLLRPAWRPGKVECGRCQVVNPVGPPLP